LAIRSIKYKTKGETRMNKMKEIKLDLVTLIEVRKVFKKFDEESSDFVTQLERLERWLNKKIKEKKQ